MAVAIAIAVPVIIYLVNGEVEIRAFVPGATIGFPYWHFGPLML